MQIIIPMAGSGQRFKKAGYKTIKPLIEVDGKPIIEYVTNLFPGEEDFLFICSQEQLDTTDLKNILLKLKPQGKVVGIKGHNLGPVPSVLEAVDEIKEKVPVVVNYCDFDMHWDYENFKKFAKDSNADGVVVCYTGFHPHLDGPNFYAGVRTDDRRNILEIKEKHSYTQNKQEGWHSNGTYYFKSGHLVKKYFHKLLSSKQSHENGEYYVSLVYNLLINDGLKNLVYPVDYFCQWGTPEDLKEYLMWMDRLQKNYQPTTQQEEMTLKYWQNFLSPGPKT